ncbi:MAG TPA: response regulator [Candidatus Melainabacteria bacterium]|nr:response regulator [Candidatus Melainabacteria bacterium]
MNEKALEILLAEDRPDVAVLTGEVLKQAGIDCNLVVVPNGVEAISYLKSAIAGSVVNPDLVLLDLNMPLSGGHDVLQEMRSELGIQEIPVIVLTVSTADEDINRALDSGMNFYLKKPARPDTLGSLVKTVVTLWARNS